MARPVIESDLWIRRYFSAPGSSPKLVCFPHAGGSASFFFPLAKMAQDELDVMAIQYPGRQDRRAEEPIDDIGVLADEIIDALRPTVDEDTVLFGHSMGAIVAFEVARRMAADSDGPRSLVVSGRRAPSRIRREQLHMHSDERLISELKVLAGTESSVLGDEELLRLVLPAVRNDYRAIERYVCGPGPGLSCPIAAFVGLGDPRVSISDARPWSEFTTGAFEVDTFEGGHFYLADRWDEVLSMLGERALPKRAA